MKLLFICHLSQHALNDTVRAIRYLGAELVSRGHEVDYFFRQGQQQEPASLLEWPMQIAPVASRQCEQNHYDIILSTGTSGWCLSSFRNWLLPGSTRIVSWHLKDESTAKPAIPSQPLTDSAALLSRPQIAGQVNAWMVEQSLKTQDGCFLTGLEELHQIRADFPQYAAKALYQPRGVAPHFYSPQRLQEKAAPASRLLLIESGGDQGHPIGKPLAEAFRRLWEMHPQISLTVAGPHLPQPDELFTDFPEAIQPALSRLDIQVETRLPDLYLQHDILIQPHGTTALPFSVLEAMASAMPAVVAQNPDFQEVVIHYENGLLVPPRDPNALVESVSHLLENPQLCQALGEAAFETVSRCYTWHQVCDIFEANLTRILEQAPT